MRQKKQRQNKVDVVKDFIDITGIALEKKFGLYPTCKVAMLVYPHQWKDCELVVNNNYTEDSTLSMYQAQEHRYSDIQ